VLAKKAIHFVNSKDVFDGMMDLTSEFGMRIDGETVEFTNNDICEDWITFEATDEITSDAGKIAAEGGIAGEKFFDVGAHDCVGGAKKGFEVGERRLGSHRRR
jgi:hypothetical protein